MSATYSEAANAGDYDTADALDARFHDAVHDLVEAEEAMEIPSWRLHELRRTAATGMVEIGIAPHTVEAALNHVSGARWASPARIIELPMRSRSAQHRSAGASHVVVLGRPAHVVSFSRKRKK